MNDGDTVRIPMVADIPLHLTEHHDERDVIDYQCPECVELLDASRKLFDARGWEHW